MEADRRIAEIMEIAELKKQNADLKEINTDLKQSLDWANERESENVKRITELEEQISILLSCKNCPENKGGYICVKEYEGKCLSQKTQYIKELQEEKAKLKDKLKNLESVAEVRLANWQKYEKENEELNKELGKLEGKIADLTSEYYELENFKNNEINKAKELLRNIIRVTWGEGWNYDLEWKVKAEQFIKEIE